jgi:DNA-binding XRE family transcriptional regulator
MENMPNEEKDAFINALNEYIKESIDNQMEVVVSDIVKRKAESIITDTINDLTNKIKEYKPNEHNNQTPDYTIEDGDKIYPIDAKSNKNFPSRSKLLALATAATGVAALGTLASFATPGIGVLSGAGTAIGMIAGAIKSTEDKELSDYDKIRLAQVYEELKKEGKVGTYEWYAGYGEEDNIGFSPFVPGAKYKVENCLDSIIKNKGIMKGKLAELVGIDRSSLSAILNGQGNPSILTVLKICSVLSITVDQAFRLVEEDAENNQK